VVGIDTQESQVAAARTLAAQRGIANARFEVGNAYEQSFPDASFDVAVARAMLFHLRDPLAALRDMRRRLASGGIVAVVDIDAGGNVVAPTLPAVERFLHFTYRVVEQSGGNPLL
jgi:ubiquinone/menaquinone biosynthesis C-methylase UbiE